MRFLKTLRVPLTLMLVSFSVYTANAQGVPLDPIKIRVVPETPEPHSPVLIELQDVTATLRDASITWILDGKVTLSGIAKRSFSFRTGGVGSITRVEVQIEMGSGALITREFSFRPGSVSLSFEADTYVPPFYKGKAVLSPGASVRVFAFTDVRDASGNRVSESNLVYEWERNGTKFADRSGLGLSSFSFQGNQLSAGEDVAVSILTRDGTRVARASLFIPSNDPLVRIYERNPLRGILYENSLNEVAFLDQELILVAEPYFFSIPTRKSGGVTFTWNLDGEAVSSENRSAFLSLRNERREDGEALVSVSVQNTVRSRLLQAAEASFPLFFGRTPTNSSLF